MIAPTRRSGAASSDLCTVPEDPSGSSRRFISDGAQLKDLLAKEVERTQDH